MAVALACEALDGAFLSVASGVGVEDEVLHLKLLGVELRFDEANLSLELDLSPGGVEDLVVEGANVGEA